MALPETVFAAAFKKQTASGEVLEIESVFDMEPGDKLLNIDFMSLRKRRPDDILCTDLQGNVLIGSDGMSGIVNLFASVESSATPQ